MVLSKNLYSLGSGVARHLNNPETFSIPTDTERRNVPVGALVKLLFVDNNFNNVERMWVEVTDWDIGGEYVGTLQNTPVLLTFLAPDDEVIFSADHIIDISSHSS